MLKSEPNISNENNELKKNVSIPLSKVSIEERKSEIMLRCRDFERSNKQQICVKDVTDRIINSVLRPVLLVSFDTEWDKIINELGTVFRSITSQQFTISWKIDAVNIWKELINNPVDGKIQPVFVSYPTQISYLYINMDKKEWFFKNYKKTDGVYDEKFIKVLNGEEQTLQHSIIGTLHLIPYSESDCEYGKAPIIDAIQRFCGDDIQVLNEGEKAGKATLDLDFTAFFAEADIFAGRWLLANPNNYKKAFDKKRKMSLKKSVQSCLSYKGGSVNLTLKDPIALMQGGLNDQLKTLNISQTLKESYSQEDKRHIDKALCQYGFDTYIDYAMGDTVVLNGLYYKFYDDLLGVFDDEGIQFVIFRNTIYDLSNQDHRQHLTYNGVFKESTGAIVADFLVNLIVNYIGGEIGLKLNGFNHKTFHRYLLESFPYEEHMSQKDHEKLLDEHKKDLLIKYRNEFFSDYKNRLPVFTEILNLLLRSGNEPLKQLIGGRGIALTKTIGGLAYNMFPFFNNGRDLIDSILKFVPKTNHKLRKQLMSKKLLGFDNDLDGAYAEVIMRCFLNLGDNRQTIVFEEITTDTQFKDKIRYCLGTRRTDKFDDVDRILEEILQDWIKNDRKYISLGLFRKYIEPHLMRDGFAATIDTMVPLSFDNCVFLSNVGMSYDGLQQTSKRELYDPNLPINENLDLGKLIDHSRIVESPESKMIAHEIVNSSYTQGFADAIKYQARDDTKKELDEKIGVAAIDLFMNNYQTYNHNFIDYNGPMDAHDPRQSQNRIDNEQQNSEFIKYLFGNIVGCIDTTHTRYQKYSQKQNKVFRNTAIKNLRKLDGNKHENRYIMTYYPVNMSASLGDVFMRNAVARRKRFPKGTPQNAAQKLINNTAYGDFASVYFPLISNAMMGNTITGKVRLGVKMMSIINPTTQLITDGGPQAMLRMISWDKKNQNSFKITDLFKDGLKTVQGDMVMENVKIDTDSPIVTKFDPETPYMIVDGVRYEGSKIKTYLANYSLKNIEEMFPKYVNICTSHQFEYKKIFDFKVVTWDGTANQCFDGSVKGSKRRGSEGGKKRYVDDKGEFLDVEPVLEIHQTLSGDLEMIQIPVPIKKSGILSYKESGNDKYKDRHTGESLFKLESGRIQPTRPPMKTVDATVEFDALDNAARTKLSIGLLAFGVRFDIEDRLVISLKKYNNLVKRLINKNTLKTESGKFISSINIDKLLDQLIKHEPYIKWMKEYIFAKQEVNMLNGLFDQNPTKDIPKKLLKVLMK